MNAPWDSVAWLSEWRASRSSSAAHLAVLPLVSAVMESSATRAHVDRDAADVSVVVNVLHLISHTKETTGAEICAQRPEGEGVVARHESSAGAIAAHAERPTGPPSSLQRRLIVVFRDMSLCGPDSLRLVTTDSVSAMHEHLFHTSSRVMLQTNLLSRVGWWAAAGVGGGDAKGSGSVSSASLRRSTDLTPSPLGSLVVRTAGNSRSGVLESLYVPAVAWLRHGEDKGFAWRHQEDAVGCSDDLCDDILAIGLDGSLGSQIKAAVCKQRLAAVFHTAMLLAIEQRQHVSDTRDVPLTLVLELGHIVGTGGADAWPMFHRCALEAATELGRTFAHLYQVVVLPTMNTSSLTSKPKDAASSAPLAPPAISGLALPAAPTVTPQPTSSKAAQPSKPAQPAHTGQATPQQAPTTTTALSTTVTLSAVAPPQQTAPAPPAAACKPGALAQQDIDENVPIWQRYEHTDNDAAAGGKRLLGTALRAPIGTDTAVVVDRGAFGNGPTEAIFIEVPFHMPSPAVIPVLGSSTVLRQILVRWCQPMLQRWQPPSSPGPLRVVVFLCHNETTVTELMLSLADTAHEDNIYVPFLFAIGDSSSRGGHDDGKALQVSEDSMHFGSQGTLETCTNGQRLQRMMDYLQDRLPRLARDKSIVVTCTDGWRELNPVNGQPEQPEQADQPEQPQKRGNDWVKSRVLHIPLMWAGGDLLNGKAREALAPLLAMVERPRSAALASSAFSSIGSDKVDRLRSTLAKAAVPVLPRVLAQLFEKPRRPEVAVALDSSSMFVGVVRPPSSIATARSRGAHHTVQEHTIRVTADERATVLDAIRLLFAQEFRSAIDVLHTNQLREARKHKGQFIPYLAGYCPLLAGARRIRLSSVVRRNVFTEVELNLQDVQQRLRTLVEAWRGGNYHPSVLDNIAMHLLPQVKCNCTPRIGEHAPRVLPGERRQLKLCRHVVQVVCHFLDVYTVDPATSTTAPTAAPAASVTGAQAAVACGSGASTAPKKRARVLLAASSGANANVGDATHGDDGGHGAAKQHRADPS